MLLSHLSEITLILKPSNTYLRFVLVMYLLSILLIINSAIFLWIKALMIIGIFIRLKFDFYSRSPCALIDRVLYRNNQWILINKQDAEEIYEMAAVIIHNPLFQLVKFSKTKKFKLVVFFNDQMTKSQLQQLHLISNL